MHPFGRNGAGAAAAIRKFAPVCVRAAASRVSDSMRRIGSQSDENERELSQTQLAAGERVTAAVATPPPTTILVPPPLVHRGPRAPPHRNHQVHWHWQLCFFCVGQWLCLHNDTRHPTVKRSRSRDSGSESDGRGRGDGRGAPGVTVTVTVVKGTWRSSCHFELLERVQQLGRASCSSTKPSPPTSMYPSPRVPQNASKCSAIAPKTSSKLPTPF